MTFAIASPGRGTDGTSQTPVIDIDNMATALVAAGTLATLHARCDSHTYVGYRSPGCVNAGYTPTDVIPAATPGGYANHVAWAEVNLKHHWGWNGHGPALHRTKTKASRRPTETPHVLMRQR